MWKSFVKLLARLKDYGLEPNKNDPTWGDSPTEVAEHVSEYFHLEIHRALYQQGIDYEDLKTELRVRPDYCFAIQPYVQVKLHGKAFHWPGRIWLIDGWNNKQLGWVEVYVEAFSECLTSFTTQIPKE